MTGPATGEFTVFGMVEESVYGTPVTVSRFLEILPGETLEAEILRHQSSALRGGTRNGLAATREIITGRQAKGDVKFEVSGSKFGLLFKHLLGGASISGTTHTYSTGVVLGKSLSLQKQFRDSANAAVKAISYNGGKIIKGSFSISKAGVLEFTATFDARQESGGVAAATASYVDPIPYSFAEGALSIAGSAVANVTTAKVDYENPAEVDRRFLGNNGFKAEPTDSDRPTVSGTLDAEFLDATAYDQFQAGTPVAFSLVFTSVTSPYVLTINVPAIVMTGSTPKAAGPGVVTQQIPWVGRVNGAGDPLMTLIYAGTDTVS